MCSLVVQSNTTEQQFVVLNVYDLFLYSENAVVMQPAVPDHTFELSQRRSFYVVRCAKISSEHRQIILFISLTKITLKNETTFGTYYTSCECQENTMDLCMCHTNSKLLQKFEFFALPVTNSLLQQNQGSKIISTLVELCLLSITSCCKLTVLVSTRVKKH